MTALEEGDHPEKETSAKYRPLKVFFPGTDFNISTPGQEGSYNGVMEDNPDNAVRKYIDILYRYTISWFIHTRVVSTSSAYNSYGSVAVVDMRAQAHPQHLSINTAGHLNNNPKQISSLHFIFHHFTVV